MNLTEDFMSFIKTRNMLGENVTPPKPSINEASDEALIKQMGKLCDDVSVIIRKMVELYDDNDNLKELEPEDFYTLIPKQFDGKLAFLAEGWDRAGVAWPKATSQLDDDEME